MYNNKTTPKNTVPNQQISIIMETPRKKPLFSTKDIAYTAICTLCIVVSAYIRVPFVLPFTLQTMAVYLALFFLGAKRGVFAVLTYLLLGLVGLPVFSGFSGGVGAFAGATGGYLIGFLAVSIIYLIAELISKSNGKITVIFAFVGIVVLHVIGAVWLYFFGFLEIDLSALIVTYVLPYFAMDIVKLIAAIFLAKLLKTRLRLD